MEAPPPPTFRRRGWMGQSFEMFVPFPLPFLDGVMDIEALGDVAAEGNVEETRDVLGEEGTTRRGGGGGGEYSCVLKPSGLRIERGRSSHDEGSEYLMISRVGGISC